MSGFPAHYPVYITDEEGTSVGTSIAYDLLPGYVSATANQHGINHIKLCGNKELSFQLAENITTIAKTEYSNNNLEIEVIA